MDEIQKDSDNFSPVYHVAPTPLSTAIELRDNVLLTMCGSADQAIALRMVCSRKMQEQLPEFLSVMKKRNLSITVLSYRVII